MDDAGHARDAFEAGAAGYLVKSSAPEELFTAIEDVLSGRRYVASTMAGKLMDSWKTPEPEPRDETLSSRESEVATLIAQGYENAEISAQLGIAQVTVRTHLLRIQRKLGLRNRVAVARYALVRGWVNL